MIRIGGAGFLNDVVGTVHFVMPRAAVPMVVASEVEESRAGDVECDVFVFGELIEEMAGVGAFVAAAAVISAAHVGAHADALIRPAVPLAVGIEANGNDGRFCCSAKLSNRKWKQQKREAQHPLI